MTHRARLRALFCGAVLAAQLGAGPAMAQDESRADIAVQNQILELRHDLDTLRDQVSANSGPAPSQAPSNGAPAPNGDALAALLNRVSQLEDQVRTLQGKVDEVGNTLRQQNADLTKQIGDLAFRVQTLEGGKGVPPAGTVPGAPTPLTSAPQPSPGPPLPPPIAHATLQQGYAALARRDYMTAEAAARDTLATPRSPRLYDAQFLLAQSLAGQRNYQQAALAYDDTYNKAHKGPHAQDALVGLASSLSAIGAKPAACATIDKLHAEFPSARADVRASAAAIGRRAECKG